MSQKTGLKRNTIDKYYTNPIIAKKYSTIFKDHIKINDNDLIIEPSAGNGVWTYQFQIPCNLIAFDLQPEAPNSIPQNFLNLDLYKFQTKLHFIGNPPFGRQSSLAKQFIKHICNCTKTETIAFILPKSFKKDSFQKIFPLTFHKIYEDDVDTNAFLVDGNPYDVPCVFQIWIRKNTNRVIPPKLNPIGFQFVKQNDNPDYSIRRVGVYAGKLSTETDKSPQSHYFIKTNCKYFKETYEKIIWEHNNTVGPKSISKQELIAKLNPLLTS